jgi:hypothetical protein
MFDDQLLGSVTHHKHIGLLMESSTSWNLHIENTISKSLKRVGIIICYSP